MRGDVLLDEIEPADIYSPVRPGRLTAAGRRGIPQVLVPGGCEYFCFGSEETIPAGPGDPPPQPAQHQRAHLGRRARPARAAVRPAGQVGYAGSAGGLGDRLARPSSGTRRRRSSVQIDNVGAAREATEHLLGLGHRDIAFLGGPDASTTVQDRVAGYRDALGGPGRVSYGRLTEESGYAATRALLHADPPTALICANDRIALGAYAALTDAGRTVPDDASVVAFDDTPIALFVRPTLTTVSIPTYDIGRTAMPLLLTQLGQDGAATPATLPTQLVVRDSSAPPHPR